MNNQQKLIQQNIAAKEELRRATSLGNPTLTAFDPAGTRARVYTISCTLSGVDQIIEDVIVQSQTGTGGRAYASTGRPILIKKNAGGRWICIGPSDRTTGTGNVQVFDEATESASAAAAGPGFTTQRVPFEYYADNVVWANGVVPFGLTIRLDADGNEV